MEIDIRSQSENRTKSYKREHGCGDTSAIYIGSERGLEKVTEVRRR